MYVGENSEAGVEGGKGGSVGSSPPPLLLPRPEKVWWTGRSVFLSDYKRLNQKEFGCYFGKIRFSFL